MQPNWIPREGWKSSVFRGHFAGKRPVLPSGGRGMTSSPPAAYLRKNTGSGPAYSRARANGLVVR
jgi:hypothetical protein